MKQEVAERWAAALTSGRFNQGQGSLNKDQKYCCLGVLCELAIEDGVPVKVTLNLETEAYTYDGHNALPPKSVVEWAGMNNLYGRYSFLNDLASDNDSGHTFEMIARTIEQNVESL